MSAVSANEWRSMIAERSGVDPVRAQEILRLHGVVASPTLPRRRSLTLRSVRFSGVKYEETEPFEFSWDGLGNGVWALLTDGNSRGKSSILGLVRGALQGRFPGARVKADIWAWIEELEVGFTLESAKYVMAVRKPRGECREEDVHARLTRGAGSAEVVVAEGPAGPGFADKVEAMFMEEFSFGHFHAFRREKGEAAEHGWNSMSSALFITSAEKVLFGDVKEDNLSLRLIQLFAGLPWVTTYTIASVAHRKVEATASRARGGVAERANSRIAALGTEIVDLEEELKGLSDPAAARARLPGLDRTLVERRRDQAAADRTMSDLADRHTEAKAVRSDARRRLFRAKEDSAAGLVFRKLEPACCPACANDFEEGRFAAVEVASCGLCGREGDGDHGEAADRLKDLEIADADSEAAMKAAEKAWRASKTAAEAAAAALADAEREVEAAQEALLEGAEAERVRMEIERRRAKQEELRDMASPAEGAGGAAEDELSVLAAAAEVTKELYEPMQKEVLTQVSKSLLRHCRDFGVENLTDMALSGNGSLKIQQGGVPIYFGGLNEGERVRVRVALALAVIEVSKERGHGRHPGMIVLDSPGSQEMTDKDFAALIGSVVDVAKQFDDIQIIVGAVTRAELEARVPVDRRHHARDDEPLF